MGYEEDLEPKVMRYCPECHEKVEQRVEHCENCGYGKTTGGSDNGPELSQNKQDKWIIRDDSDTGFTGKISGDHRLPEERLRDNSQIMIIFIDWDLNEVITDWKIGQNDLSTDGVDYIRLFEDLLNRNLTIDEFIGWMGIFKGFRLIVDPRSSEGTKMPAIRRRGRSEPANDKKWMGRFVFRS